jgi:hypothetical protein
MKDDSMGEVVSIWQDGGLMTIELVREGTTNISFQGTMSWGNPTLPLFATAMGTGLRVTITGDAVTCTPRPWGSGGGTMTKVGNIIATTFTK